MPSNRRLGPRVCGTLGETTQLQVHAVVERISRKTVREKPK
jgi:hypothetical protein